MPTAAAQQEATAALEELVGAVGHTDRALLFNTDIGIEDSPTAGDNAQVGTPRDALLVGMFTAPPSRVTVFERHVRTAGLTIRQVTLHELGHAMGYLHGECGPVIGCLSAYADGCLHCTDPAAGRAQAALAPAPRGSGVGDNCPMCKLHRALAEADRLLAGASLAGPGTLGDLAPGAGGTIPVVRRRMAEARALIPTVARMAPAEWPSIAELDACLTRSQQLLGGHLDYVGADMAASNVHVCWQLGYQIVLTYFASVGHPAPA